GSVRMGHLIDSLLAYAQVGAAQRAFDRVELAAVIAEVVQNLRHKIDHDKGSVNHGELSAVHGDAVLLVQLFQNLIGNAIKFHREGVAPAVTISAREVPHGVEIAVADNGIGIPSEDCERIFELFTRLHGREHFDGSGIGLATCRLIVERLGGSIAVDSQPGEGAVFRVVLPKALGAPASA
ncbi:MAG: hypothetical protein H0X45_14135, partial [Planctomycetes bacterium]|nr:hypothetical protein [Planctomycetota bacterium]